MIKNLLEQIDNLPPLPQTIIEIGELEKKYLGVTTSKATAEIFRHWKLSNNLIKIEDLNFFLSLFY